MKTAITATVTVTIFTDKKPESIKGAMAKGVLRELDLAGIAPPLNVKIESEIVKITKA